MDDPKYDRDGPNAEELQEWIRGYTENFFAPAFPPEEPDTTLVFDFIIIRRIQPFDLIKQH